MIADNPKVPRAERLSAIVDLGLAAWAARWPLYLAIAAVSVGLELVAALLSRYDAVVASVVLPCIDGFVMAFVSLDVAARFAGEAGNAADIARATLRRGPIVAVLLLILMVPSAFVQSWLFGNAEDTLYGMLILPGLVGLGIMGICTAIGSVDDTSPIYAVPGLALLRSMVYSLAWPNLGRLTLAGAGVAVSLMLQQLIDAWLTARGMAAGPAYFWANVPVDALTLAPFQAFFTYLFLDFTVREQRR